MPTRVIPVEYLGPARIQRVVVHWTAGAYQVSASDRQHYHVVLQDDFALTRQGDVSAVRGVFTPADNDVCEDGRYAGHTRGLNGHSFGLSLACMAGAEEGGPYGRWPITPRLWERGAKAAAEICDRYGLEVTERTVLQHWEVTRVYGVEQRGKWDIAELPWATDLSREGVAAQFRRKCLWYLHRLRSEQ